MTGSGMPVTQKNSRIVGLYSFPKSGNTWLRAIIAALSPHGQNCSHLQKIVPDTHFGSAIAHPWELQGTEWRFYKSHHKQVLATDSTGAAFRTDKILYIYRHPLDVFCSYLNFASNQVSPNAGLALPFQYDSIDALDPDAFNALFTIFLKFATLVPRNVRFGGVFEHFGNFQDLARETGQVHILKYEDLHDDFDGSLQSICGFLGLTGIDAEQVFAAADQRTRPNGRFFWQRRKDTFRNLLTDLQIQRFHDRWSAPLQEMGYACD